jgi:hypothetical protein
MNEQQLAAVKQALEALDIAQGLLADAKSYHQPKMLAAYTALQSIISQNALDKKAENARELGLSYDPAPVWRYCSQAEQELYEGDDADDDTTAPQPVPVQEPVAWGIIAGNTGRICQAELDADEIEGHNPKHIVPLYTTPPTPQQKPWVGLTDEERSHYLQTASNVGWWQAAQIIEAKLKEKNT